jgi:hypothetical protein
MPPVAPFSSETIPGLASGVNYCILRVNRTFDGVYEGSQRGSAYSCEIPQLVKQERRFSASITWRITAPLVCDEVASLWPSTQLTAKGITIARLDGFAHFVGKCSIVQKTQGGGSIPFFKGVLELIGRSGSHQHLGENCDEEEHVEGWIIAAGQRSMAKYCLRVSVVASGNLSPGTHAFPLAAVNRLTGTLLKSP